jgi:hypothetical protein
MKKAAGTRLPSFTSHESELVTGAFDFIGLNHYSSIYASNNPDASGMALRDQAADVGALFRGGNACTFQYVRAPNYKDCSIAYGYSLFFSVTKDGEASTPVQ